MERTFIEKLLVVIAWAGLIGGILFTFLVSKGIMESNMEMAFPQVVVTFVGGIGASIVGWVVLMQIVNISDRLRMIENQLSK
ncbi:MAG: hypothetical protein IJT53_05075 [Prevotella sp.]|nr:hypothetical protein [Prevotella sp.]